MDKVIKERVVRVYINGVKIPDRLVGSVSIKYEKIPGLSSCSLSLLDYYGVFTNRVYGNLDSELESFNFMLVESYAKMEYTGGKEVVSNCPLIADGDLVWVFVKINNTWWWGFFGYVNGYEYNVEVSGVRRITVSCEDGLRPYRLERTVFNELVKPDFGTGDVNSIIDDWIQYRLTPMLNTFQGMGFYDKIKEFFQPQSLAGKVLEAKAYKLVEMTKNIDELKNNESAKRDYFTTINKVYYYAMYIGDDEALERKVEELIDEYDSSKKIGRLAYFIRLEAPENTVLNFLTMQLQFSALNVSNIIGMTKIDLFKKVLEASGYECFLLPSGDMVIEPCWFGMLKTKEDCEWYDREFGKEFNLDNEKLFVVDKDKVLSFSLGYSGNDIKSVSLVKYSLLNEQLNYIPAKGIPLRHKIYRHGFRETFPTFFMWNVVREDIAVAIGFFELIRNWFLVRSVNCRILNPDIIYVPNRQMYYEDIDGIFQIVSSTLNIDKDNKMVAGIVGKAGIFNNGSGEYKMECFMNAENQDVLNIRDIVDCYGALAEDIAKINSVEILQEGVAEEIQ